MSFSLPPQPDRNVSRLASRAWLQHGHIFAALETLHLELGDVFRIPFPGFRPIVLVGPEANRFVFSAGHERLVWRSERDPVTMLLRHGLLVEDGQSHDRLRSLMAPALHHSRLEHYAPMMLSCIERVCATWTPGATYNMVAEMRHMTLLILMQSLFGVDFSGDVERLWPAIMRALAYISPGAWLVWPNIPRLGYGSALRQIDAYLLGLIRARRLTADRGDDLLSLLVATPGLSDDLIRDQLLTMLIAGHDTSTALLAWALYLLGRHPETLVRLQGEIDTVLGDCEPDYEKLKQLRYLEQVIKETLRLYPPIHLGQRIAATDLTFQDYDIPAGARVIYTIYLTHRMQKYWPEPARFHPERFGRETQRRQTPHAYIPFGGGARNCIGAGFGLLEAKLVLARLIQQFKFTLIENRVQPHLGATLMPHPTVMMRIDYRRRS
jgi:cytochrome P450